MDSGASDRPAGCESTEERTSDEDRPVPTLTDTFTIEPTFAIVRHFKPGSIPNVDPFPASAMIVFHDLGRIAEIRGVASEGQIPFIRLRNEFAAKLRAVGVEKFFFDRKRNGTNHRAMIKTHRPGA